MEEKVKIALVDDELLFRKGISFLLNTIKEFEVVFEASNGEELIHYLEKNEKYPDIIMMDLKMPVINGVEATKIINKSFPSIKIIALTSYNTPSFIANMINVGASSYLVKNATPDEMIFTISEVAEKGFYYNEEVMNVIHQDIINTNQSSKSKLDDEFLTSREKEVLGLICQQLSTNEIAEKLFISPRTVDGHRNNLLLKTESKNMAGLVVFAIQNKIVNINDVSL